MSNKITRSDLEKLINEAMGLKMETPEDDADLERSAFQDFSREDYDDADVLDLDTGIEVSDEKEVEPDEGDSIEDVANEIVSFLHEKNKLKYYLRIKKPESKNPGIFKAKQYSVDVLNNLLKALIVTGKHLL